MIEVKEHPARNPEGGPLLPKWGAVYLDKYLVAYITPNDDVIFIQYVEDPEEIIKAVTGNRGNVAKVSKRKKRGSKPVLETDSTENQDG